MAKQGRQQKVFFVSDRTGLTAHSYGHSLLAQFPGFSFDSRRFAFVDSVEQAEMVAQEIDRLAAGSEETPIVFTTLVESDTQAIIEQTQCCIINLFGTFLGPLEQCLGVESAHTLGKSTTVFGENGYNHRLDAIDYAMAHDDGIRPDHYEDANLILVGVSRCGKTPTSLFLAMNYSLKAANYPLTEDDLDKDVMPKFLLDYKDKLVGLSITPLQLSNIREKRRPGSAYASLPYCKREVRIAEEMFRRADIPFFDTTATSIEELAGSVIKTLRLQDDTAS